MSDQTNPHKIVQLRTFATDAKRARLAVPEEVTSSLISIEPKEDVRVEQRTELQKKSHAFQEEMSKVGKSERSSILSDTGLTYESEGSGEGVIIRDKKRKRYKLLPAMIEASTSWFSGIQDTQQKRRNRIPKVKTAESRIEVIQKAVAGSEQAPKEDYSSVAEHLKNTERVPISTAISFKEKSEVPEPTWSSVASPEIPENTNPVVVVVPVVPIQEVVPEIQVTHVEPVQAVQAQAPHLEVTEVREQVIDTALDALFDSKEEVLPTEEPVVEMPPLAQQEEPEKVFRNEVPEIVEETFVPYQTLKQVTTPLRQPVQYAPPRVNTARASWYVYAVIGVIIISSLAGVFVTYYFFSLTSTSPISTSTPKVTPVSESLIQEQSSKVYTMPKTATEHVLEIQKNIQSTQAVTRFIPHLQNENGMQEATIAEILSSLELRAPSSFVRSIKEITLGGVDGQDLFIVLRVSTFDVAFAGMLSWEETIQSDFSPLFNTNTTRAVTFTDTLTSNKNTRVLKDGNGEDVLTYTFTDKNTIVITSTRAVLERLIPLVK